MAQLRSVNTKFWDDPWIEDLTVTNKLLFLYLITNGYANLAGIYEISIKRISFETGIDKQSVSNGLELFAKDDKAYFVNENYIFLPNWLKNQNLNSNMKKGVVSIIKQLPKDVKISILGNDYQTIQEDYQTIRNTLLKYEVLEDEVLEEEDEGEKLPITPEKKFIPPTLEDVKQYFKDNGYKEEIAEKAFKYYSTAKWKDSKGSSIKNWKQKMIGVWFKDEHKDQTIQPNPSNYKEFENFCSNNGKTDRWIQNVWKRLNDNGWKTTTGKEISNWKEFVKSA